MGKDDSIVARSISSRELRTATEGHSMVAPADIGHQATRARAHALLEIAATPFYARLCHVTSSMWNFCTCRSQVANQWQS